MKIPSDVLNRRSLAIQQQAGFALSKPIKALVGNPATREIRNTADSRANAVFVHGVGEDPADVVTALSKLELRDLLFGAPVELKRTLNGFVITGIDEDADEFYAGADARNNQIAVYLNQVLYGTLHPEPDSGSMRVLVIGAMLDAYFVDDQFSADFSASPTDLYGATISLPTTGSRAIAVLLQVDAQTGTLSYKQSAEFDASLNLVQAYKADLLPSADVTRHRLGYVKLVAGMTVIGYDKIWSLPELLNKAPAFVGVPKVLRKAYTVPAEHQLIVVGEMREETGELILDGEVVEL